MNGAEALGRSPAPPRPSGACRWPAKQRGSMGTDEDHAVPRCQGYKTYGPDVHCACRAKGRPRVKPALRPTLNSTHSPQRCLRQRPGGRPCVVGALTALPLAELQGMQHLPGQLEALPLPHPQPIRELRAGPSQVKELFQSEDVEQSPVYEQVGEGRLELQQKPADPVPVALTRRGDAAWRAGEYGERLSVGRCLTEVPGYAVLCPCCRAQYRPVGGRHAGRREHAAVALVQQYVRGSGCRARQAPGRRV